MPELTAEELDALGREAADALGARAIGDVRPLAGGASRELLAFDAVTAGCDPVELVLLRSPAGLVDASRRDREFQALSAAHDGGVPVPEPLWRTGDERGIVMRRMAGEAIPRRILRDQLAAGNGAAERLLGQVAAAAAATHRVAPRRVPALQTPAGPPAEAVIEGLESELDRIGEPHPALELGLRWLRARLPLRRDPVLVHGDLRMGNLLVSEGDLVAVLDWELCHLGDPVQDLGWMCIRSWRFGADDRPAAGLGSRERLVELYEAAGGAAVDLEELRFWEVLGNVHWGVLCVRQAHTHLGGCRESIEHAAIGRRTCEPEWDMLEMIG